MASGAENKHAVTSNRKRRMGRVGSGEEGWLGRDKAKRSREAER